MLVFDTEQYNCTGVYTLYTKDMSMCFTFKDALAAKDFVDKYYTNKILAMYAYEASKDYEFKSCGC